MIERETRKRKENTERQPKKKCSKMFIWFAQGKGINTLPPPPSGRSRLSPLKWILLVGLHP